MLWFVFRKMTNISEVAVLWFDRNFLYLCIKIFVMADNYLGKKMEDHQRAAAPARRTSRSLSQLLERNRSHRAFDPSFRVREDQLRRIVEVATKVPSARNQQVLRFRMVLADEAAKVLPHIRLGGALPELHLPVEGTEPNAFIIICSTAAVSHYVSVDLGIVAQSMLLQAVEIGLNGICIGAFDAKAVSEAFDLRYEPVLILAIGRGMDKIRLKEIGEEEDHRYYREDGIHYVPKVRVEDLILK